MAKQSGAVERLRGFPLPEPHAQQGFSRYGGGGLNKTKSVQKRSSSKACEKDALSELFWAEIHRPEAPKPAC